MSCTLVIATLALVIASLGASGCTTPGHNSSSPGAEATQSTPPEQPPSDSAGQSAEMPPHQPAPAAQPRTGLHPRPQPTLDLPR
jgi:hypothetical protein